MDYDWDPKKAESNFEKHGIRFSDAAGALEDEQALVREDLHAVGERRFVAIGLDFLGRIVTVVFTDRETNLRLISARAATRREQRAYVKEVPMSDEIAEPRAEYDLGHAKRGPVVPPDPNMTRVNIRLNTGVLGWFRDRVEQAGGGSYQTMINEALQEHVQRQMKSSEEPSEEMLRRVLREEIQAASK